MIKIINIYAVELSFLYGNSYYKNYKDAMLKARVHYPESLYSLEYITNNVIKTIKALYDGKNFYKLSSLDVCDNIV